MVSFSLWNSVLLMNFEEDVHFVGTDDSAACSNPKVIQFPMALITASKSCSNHDLIIQWGFHR